MGVSNNGGHKWGEEKTWEFANDGGHKWGEEQNMGVSQ